MLGEIDLMKVGKRLIKAIGEDDISGAATELAYRLFLAIFPFFIFLAAFGGFIADLLEVRNPTQEIMDSLGESLPPDAASVLQRELDSVINSRDLGLVSIGILGAVFAASSGVGTIAKALNRIYGVRETRSRWKRFALALGLTFLGGGFLIGGFLILIIGQLYGLELAQELGIEGATATIFAYSRWPLVIVLVLTALAFLYWAAPNVDLPFKWITPGAVIATIGWLGMTFLFGQYVANFGSYNATYGTLGGVVIALVWFYLSGFVVLLGAEINAVLVEEVMPEELPQTMEEGATAEKALDEQGDAATRRQGREPDPAVARGPGPFALLAGVVVAMLALSKLRGRS